MDDLRENILKHKCKVSIDDVECYALALSQLSKQLVSLKTSFSSIKEQFRSNSLTNDKQQRCNSTNENKYNQITPKQFTTLFFTMINTNPILTFFFFAISTRPSTYCMSRVRLFCLCLFLFCSILNDVDRFLSIESSKLDLVIRRCKRITGILIVLKKLNFDSLLFLLLNFDWFLIYYWVNNATLVCLNK